MSKYSEFELKENRTRNEIALDESLKDIKSYKTPAQNFNDLDGRYFDDKNFYGVDNIEKYDDAPPNNFFNDPRYTQNQTRNISKKQMNVTKNLKTTKGLSGLETNSNLGSFEETNYEDSKFRELNRNLQLGVNHPLKGYVNIKANNEIEERPKSRRSSKIDLDSEKEETDLAKIIKKVKGTLDYEDQRPVMRMPKKKIFAKDVKGKILQFKNIPDEIQDMISHALITIWKDDFALKKITSYIGVKNFILHNFKDKMNSFFVLFDDDGDFVSTFAVDTENFAPYISHLYVNPNVRGKGFGKKSLKYSEKYIKKLGFSSANLWCEEPLTGYYKKNGYSIDSQMRISEDKMVWKMIKNLE
jgi:GNAT superfamily N-acetyltransferase